jgi:hypothetical protein
MNELERIKDLGEGLPAPQGDARDAARAALVARFEAERTAGAKPAPRRFLRVRNFVFAGELAIVAAALVIALGTGGGSGVKPEVASAAALNHLADLSPRFGIAGGWQITHTEASPDGGETRFHYERGPDDEAADVEIRWHAAPLEEVAERVEAEGLETAGTLPMNTRDVVVEREGNYGRATTYGTAQVYADRDEEDEDLFLAVGLWREDGWTFELRAPVESLYILERRLERIEILGQEEWLVAIQPGGAMWLRETLNGTVRKVEHTRTVNPDGTVYMLTRFEAKSEEELEELDFTAPVPVIHREGDSARVEVARAPG